MKPKLGRKKIPVCNGAGTDPKGFEGGRFVDRTREIERMRGDGFNQATGSPSGALPGHKQMAGMR